jgi:hypothetical protein
MVVLEWVRRITTLVIPFFYRMEVQSTRQVVALAVMLLALLLYYACWVRYFVRGRLYALLFEPFLGVPLPLAISPIVYFLAACSIWLMVPATGDHHPGRWASVDQRRRVQRCPLPPQRRGGRPN